MKRQARLLCAILGVAACSGQSDGGPAVTARPEGANAQPAAAAPVNTEAEVSNGPNSMMIKPGHVFACDGRDRAVSTISWRSTDPAVSRIAIKVQAPEGGEGKVFTIGGSEGSAETGNWMTPGVRVAMVDDATGRELASHTVTAFPCN